MYGSLYARSSPTIVSTLISILGPIATLIVGCAVAFIAWQQWQVANSKLRLDLFDRRYKVYDATRKFVAGIVSEATFSDAQLFTFTPGLPTRSFCLVRTLWTT
jgi:hypothetical protein